MKRKSYGLHISNRATHEQPEDINNDYKIYKKKKGRNNYFGDFTNATNQKRRKNTEKPNHNKNVFSQTYTIQ